VQLGQLSDLVLAAGGIPMLYTHRAAPNSQEHLSEDTVVVDVKENSAPEAMEEVRRRAQIRQDLNADNCRSVVQHSAATSSAAKFSLFCTKSLPFQRNCILHICDVDVDVGNQC
jgi:hypothetical protein